MAGTAFKPERDFPPESYLLLGVRLHARWRGEVPSWRELAALRHVFPALINDGIGELAARLRGGESFLSEPVTPTEADRLIAEAKARGLVLEPTGEPACIELGGARSLSTYEAMWTSDLHKYGLLELGPERGGGTLIFDLEAMCPMTFDEDEAIVVAVIQRMREAGVRRLTRDETRPR
jgi:hypothetical protein